MMLGKFDYVEFSMYDIKPWHVHAISTVLNSVLARVKALFIDTILSIRALRVKVARNYRPRFASILTIGVNISMLTYIPLSFASDDLLKPESELVQTCAACHGADGNSAVPTFPSLAGQLPGYLLHEIGEYKNHFRNDDSMNPVVEPLSKEDIVKLTKYFAAQKPVVPTPGEAIDPLLVAEGKKLYSLEHGIRIACSDCHGDNGEGYEATRFIRDFPRLASQQYDYLVTELQQYASGKKTHGLLGMRRAGLSLSEYEIKALAAYLTSLE